MFPPDRHATEFGLARSGSGEGHGEDDGEAGHDAEGEGIADEAIYELVQTVPLPRRFVARIWGPKGATVEYVFQLLRTNSPVPEDDFARWDNNQLQNYRMVL